MLLNPDKIDSQQILYCLRKFWGYPSLYKSDPPKCDLYAKWLFCFFRSASNPLIKGHVEAMNQGFAHFHFLFWFLCKGGTMMTSWALAETLPTVSIIITVYISIWLFWDRHKLSSKERNISIYNNNQKNFRKFFIFHLPGGCRGNKNRFMTEEACQNSCGHVAQIKEATRICKQVSSEHIYFSSNQTFLYTCGPLKAQH